MVSINFIGDIALFKEFQDKKTDPFKEISLPESNFNIANFEFVIPNNRKKSFFDVLDQYAIDYEYLDSLNLDRFNAFGIANNHCMDYGKEGIQDMVHIFKKHGISSFGFGTDDFNVLKFEVKGISFAVIAAVKKGRWSRNSESQFGPDSYATDKIISKIKSLKGEADHIIVFPHFGTELVDIPEPADVKNSRMMINSGASAVIGHHPHIIQGIEKYENGVIAYSLGSFIYIPENEQGYKADHSNNRDYSICLNLTFNKNAIVKIIPSYYKYDNALKLPLVYTGPTQYFERVNSMIENSTEYYKSVRRHLLKREAISFFQRFKKNPLSTIIHYSGYIKFKHIRKALS